MEIKIKFSYLHIHNMYEQTNNYMRRSNYDKYPATRISGMMVQGWMDIIRTIRRSLEDAHIKELAVELYTGVYEDEVIKAFTVGLGTEVIDTRTLMKPESEIRRMTEVYMTDDVLFGYVTALRLNDYFDDVKLAACRRRISGNEGMSVVVGTGASLAVSDKAMVVYIDMARWEIQQRFRRHEVKALGVDNHNEAPSLQYKRGYFNDWRICDMHKDSLFRRVAFWIDTHIAGSPKMIDRDTFFKGIDATVKTPFRVVPFFDPAPWGGQWMKEVCDLDRSQRKELLESLIADFGIGRVRRQPGYTLSGGERRRTEIARALATSPSFLLLDEPFAGIDPKAVYEIKQIIRTLSARGIGILLTDHNVRDALSITTCAHIISDGRIVVSGTSQELIENPLAQEIYFGEGFREDILQ